MTETTFEANPETAATIEAPADTGATVSSGPLGEFSLDEIADFKAPAPEVKAEPTEDEQAIAEEKAQEKEAEVEAKAEVKAEKPRSKYIPRDRFDEVTARANEAQKLADERAAQLAELQANNQKLVEFIKKATEGATPKEAAAIEDEIVDVKAYQDLNAKIESLQNQLAVNAFQSTIDHEKTIGNQLHPDFDRAVDYNVAHKAYEMIENAKTFGQTLSQEAAIKAATNAVVKELYDIKSNGGNLRPGALADHVYRQALVRGYKPSGTKAEQPRARVDIAAVNRARETAGAPQIEKTTVNMNNGQGWADLAAQGAKDGLDAGYLARLGITA